MKMNLSPRLNKIASLVPVCDFVCDVGSDHAYLPIALVQKGICKKALASDLRKGPCERAKENIALYSLSDRISVVCTPGLENLDSYTPDCIVIAGMGAEIMSKILAASEMPKRKGVTLVLQPMKYAERLRSYLCREGFEIDGEYLVRDGHMYQIIVAHYTGTPCSLPTAQLYLGKRDVRFSEEEFPSFAQNQTARLKRILQTKDNAEEEKKLLFELEKEIGY